MDDDVTPFPNEKLDTDIYGSPAPIIGSRRALALARQNAFADVDRPDSEYTDNRAGLGTFPLVSPDYGVDAQGRPYRPQAGRTPIPHARPVSHHEYTLTPVAMGRPAAPTTQAELDQLDDFDVPETHVTYNLPYDGPDCSTQAQLSRPLSAIPPPAPIPLPVLEPMSPLMKGFRTSQLPMYAPDNLQKRMYDAPIAAGSTDTHSSFSANEPMRLPMPEPYVHGRPLSPLTEVATPASTAPSNPREVNPFERALIPPRTSWGKNSLAPTAVSSRSGLGYPSPAFPPSPGVSVPGSVGSSPRWSGHAIIDEDVYGGI
jgi:hypothetical protein